LVQETIVRALLDYTRLVERGKVHLAYATPLARYAVAHVRQGRRVGSRMNGCDVTSEYCRGRKGVRVESLDRFDTTAGEWQEILIENRHSTPAEIAAARIDVAQWLSTLPERNRRIAESLATGECTSCVAKMFAISAGRVAQLRRTLQKSWAEFQQQAAPILSQ
jgi:DNA-directed RNA polymerase specialized sigma24 family protein